VTPRLPAGCVIAVLGAGGSTLAQALAQRLQTRGVDAVVESHESLSEDTLAQPMRWAITLLAAPGDTGLRAALGRANRPYSVVHGASEAERLGNAWNAINFIADSTDGARAPGRFDSQNTAWRWSCDKCSDPACEHRLFSELVNGRSGSPAADPPAR
jgi:hypothetical protein